MIGLMLVYVDVLFLFLFLGTKSMLHCFREVKYQLVYSPGI